MVVWQYHKLFPCCLIIGVLFLSSHCQSGFSKALWQFNYFFDCCCQHELEQHARPWMIKSANRSPGTVVPFPLLPSHLVVINYIAWYSDLYWWYCAFTGLAIINGKSKRRNTFFASFEIFGSATCLRTAFPALTTGMSKRRLGSGASKARVSKSHTWRAQCFHILRKSFHRQLIYTWSYDWSLPFHIVFSSIHRGDQIRISSKPGNMIAFQNHCQIGF